MENDNKQAWILAGYEIFSKEGPKGLKVEVISRQVGKSKSSFYHHFSDLEVFTELLLNYHLQMAEIIAQREKLCKNIEPDLINILVDVKKDLLFNRQLRINRTVQTFKECFERSNKLVEEAFLDVWAKDIGLPDKTKLASNVLDLTLENFYLQITEDTLNHKWLSNYFSDLKSIISQIKKS